ncbi:FAD-dependent monooxygenase [Nocardia sp. CA-120079]|uniref:FAD-dependent monooxygenase n=1 Tax=Nocardia sp. CA-120079 TaxID=3239974 RepID=UPI003D95DF9C
MSRASTSRDPIIVVGGGLGGLMTARGLLRRGVECEVVDKRPEPSSAPKAITAHAALLQRLANDGIADQLKVEGIPVSSMDYHFPNDASVLRMDFTQLYGTRYPHVLVSRQATIERILRKELALKYGCRVQWGTRLVDLETDEDRGTTATLVGTDGGVRVARPDWLVGCDGVRSIVRRLLQIPFEGDEFPSYQRMIDARLYGYTFAPNSINYFMSDAGLLFIARLPDDPEIGEIYRIIISERGGDGPRAATTRETFQVALDRQFGGRVTLGKSGLASDFTIAHRVATHFRVGDVLLGGDAAHCHSIAGGMGMNKAGEDGDDLGWMLAMVAKGQAQPSLLDNYAQNRRLAAMDAGATARHLHGIIMEHNKSHQDRHKTAVELTGRSEIVGRISGLSQIYSHDVFQTSGLTPLEGLASGSIAPNIRLTTSPADDTWVHDLVDESYTLLAFQSDPNSTSELGTLAARVTHSFGDRVRVKVITPRELSAAAPAGAIISDNAEVHNVYGDSREDTLCLVQPNLHLVRRCHRSTGQEALLTKLKAVLT